MQPVRRRQSPAQLVAVAGGALVAVLAGSRVVGAVPLPPPPVLEPAVTSARLDQYDEAPGTPDADDPALWVGDDGATLVIVALKDGGLQVLDLAGEVVQAVAPPNRPEVTVADPPSPLGVGPATGPCPGSDGSTFGRFNNVDVVQDVAVADAPGATVDLAVATDRGCDRIRAYRIDPSAPGGPLVEVTADDVPRAFPDRPFVAPSPLQPAEVDTTSNPVDDQDTAYGLALWPRPDGRLFAFASQRSRSVVRQFELSVTTAGVGYAPVRDLWFDPVFEARGRSWSPCREEPAVDPQLEGLAVDPAEGVLYAAQETVGLWKVRLSATAPRVVRPTPQRLIEPVRSFGRPWSAIADDGEWECGYGEDPDDLEGDVVATPLPGAVPGRWLEADAEGLALLAGEGERDGVLVASSQGDSTFHVFTRGGGDVRFGANRHLGAFAIDGVADTDGLVVSAADLGGPFTGGLLVTQAGDIEPPDDLPDEIAGFEYDGSTRFALTPWAAVVAALGLEG